MKSFIILCILLSLVAQGHSTTNDIIDFPEENNILPVEQNDDIKINNLQEALDNNSDQDVDMTNENQIDRQLESNDLITGLAEEHMDQSSPLLEGELPLMMREFQSIMQEYNKNNRSNKQTIALYRRLLIRLDKMRVNTPFLFGQVHTMKASLRYRLNLDKQAQNHLIHVFTNSSLSEIRDEAAMVWISFAFGNGDLQSLKELTKKKFSQYYSQNIGDFLDLMIKAQENKLNEQDIQFIMDKFILAPKTSFQNPYFSYRLLTKISKQVPIKDWDRLIDQRLYQGQYAEAMQTIRLRLNLSNTVNYATLVYWGENLSYHKQDFVSAIKAKQAFSEDYKKYYSQYQLDKLAQSRGNTYHKSLFRYRGETENPYNAQKSFEIMSEYLKGSIEKEYLEKNARRAFRSILAVEDFQKITELAQLIEESSLSNVISPYISYWLGFSYSQISNSQKATEYFTKTIAESPDSYCGILAQVQLKQSAHRNITKRMIDEFKIQGESDPSAQIRYANLLAYVNSDFNNGAKKYLLDKGVFFVSTPAKISTKGKRWLNGFSTINMVDSIRNWAYLAGANTLYSQDSVVIMQFIEQQNLKDLLTLLDNRNIMLKTKSLAQLDISMMKQYYPLPYATEMNDASQKVQQAMDVKVDKNLVYSVMRSESFYREQAQSPVGARGLMQIMPKTGKWLIDRYQIKNPPSMNDPNLNIYLGIRYLYENITKMGVLPALAGYNSGPNFVDRLQKQYMPKTDTVLVEIHPKKETREYIKKILTAYQRYLMLYERRSVVNTMQKFLNQ